MGAKKLFFRLKNLLSLANLTPIVVAMTGAATLHLLQEVNL